MQPPEGTPYLSVVATARNDDHGGNLLRRLQTFVNALIGQAKRHGVPLELVLVEWNPPVEKPLLSAALEWPEHFGPASVRILQVPPEVHNRYKHSGTLPLYQMIAKNVGVRRAHGKFILATNIDILFSDELFQLFAQQRLKSGKMYRVNRYDVASEVPVSATVDEQLEYARTHLIRVNAHEGTFGLTPEGLRAPAAEDILAPASGVFLGRGWFPPGRYFGELSRWADNDAEVIVKTPAPGCVLAFELEPGPGVGYEPFPLQAIDESGAVVAEARVGRRGRFLLRPPFEPGRTHVFRLRVIGGGRKVAHDPRILNFRASRCAWDKSGSITALGGRAAARIVKGWNFFSRGARFVAECRRAKGPLRVGLPIPPRWVEKLRLRVEGGGISVTVGRAKPPAATPVCDSSPDDLHTNACGDFTLLAREHWLDLRGYPEFDVFSMNLDSAFCYTAHYGGAPEEMIEEPMRIYHIEHAEGSGWTPEGHAKLFERVAGKGLPWIDYPEIVAWASQMHRLGSPMIFNGDNWGLADIELPETLFPAGPK